MQCLCFPQFRNAFFYPSVYLQDEPLQFSEITALNEINKDMLQTFIRKNAFQHFGNLLFSKTSNSYIASNSF